VEGVSLVYMGMQARYRISAYSWEVNHPDWSEPPGRVSKCLEVSLAGKCQRVKEGERFPYNFLILFFIVDKCISVYV